MNTVSPLMDADHHGAAGAESTVSAARPVIGSWSGDSRQLFLQDELYGLVSQLDKPLFVVEQRGQPYFTQAGAAQLSSMPAMPATGQAAALSLRAYLPPLSAGQLGDSRFCADHRLRFPYMTGAMANGIASVELVTAVAQAGLLGSFGAAGLAIDEIDRAIAALCRALADKPFCANLIFSPNETAQEHSVVDVFLQHGLRLVEASAYMDLTTAVVKYRVHGIHEDAHGQIVTPNHIIAKCSRIEVARKWFSPPADKYLQALVGMGAITEHQAELARQIPMAQDVTVEADSGGHTDNRPAITLLPTIMALRDRMQNQYHYPHALRVGLGGGIATPMSAAAAFAMGAAYIVTGTINQACRESGSSDVVRGMLAEAEQADVVMAPAVDMFEMGVKLQVLKRGSMFAMRANRLYELYRAYDSIDAIPLAERQNIEKTIFRAPLAEVWNKTQDFFLQRDPKQVERARTDARHKMALVFRSYLGLSSRWANAGVAQRQIDYQIWCGPAMGAFNEWTRGSFLQQPENRAVVTVANNIIYGAAVCTRLHQLRQQGVIVDAESVQVRPLPPSQLEHDLL